MAIDVLKLFAGRPLAIDRGALPTMAEQAAARLGGAGDIDQARARFAASESRRSFSTTPAGDVALVQLTGVIDPNPFMAWLFGGTSPDDLIANLRAAQSQAAAIVLWIDSPGGSADLIPETAEAIRAINLQTPITAIARSTAASAAYWLACSCNEIVASPSAELGSIGVFTMHYDESGLNAGIGIKPTYIVSDGSPFKTELSSDAPLSPEAFAYQQSRVNETCEAFVNAVARGRDVSATQVKSGFGKGRMMGAAAAVRAGLADRIGTLEQVVSTARSRAGAGARGRLARAQADAEDLDLSIRMRSRMM